MGVIQRQGIKNSIVSYFGVLIGAISTIFIYPLSLEAYGLARFLIDTSMLLLPFVLVGMNALVVRFFPVFRNQEKGHHGFLGTLLLGAFIGVVLFTLFTLLFKDLVYSYFAEKELIGQFIFYIVPLTCLVGVCELLTQYTSNFQRIVVPGIFNLLIKITLPLLILLFYHQYIGIETVVHGIVLNFAVVLLFLLVYLKFLGQLHLKPDFSILNRNLVKEMSVYIAFGVVGLLGSMFASRIDTFMIGTILDERLIGTYGILMFIASVIEIPRLAIERVAGPIISQAWKDNDIAHIETLYKKTSINQMVVGSLLFLLIYTNLDSLFEIMPKGTELRAFKHIVLFIGLAKLIDMSTGINHHIIGYSRFFRFNFYALVFMSILNIIANLLLIPRFGIIGAALATLFSISLFNVLKFSYIYAKIKLQPFDRNTVKVVGIALILLLISHYIFRTGIPLLDIFIKSIILSSIFIFLIIKLKVSEDIEEMKSNLIRKILNKE